MKEQILKLRAEGKNYNEIIKIVGCSKGTVSYYCGDNQKEKSLARLKNSRGGFLDKSKTIKKDKFCKDCNTKLKNNLNTFCNIKCSFSFKKKISLVKFNEGKIATNNTIRGILIYLYGDICSICEQKSMWNGLQLVLQVDHINGDSDNNLPNNLRLLCPNCHSQLPTSKNKARKDTRRNSYLREYKGY